MDAFTAPAPADRRPTVVLSWGLGVDSTAILLRWILDPSSRGFDLADLVVVVAMTGDEWPETGQLADEHVLPLLAERGVRLVQVARAGRSVAQDGITVLDDSTAPTRLHIAGDYRLSDELLESGTVPQAGGDRLCSVHAKGDILDPTIARLTGGAPFLHAIGFELGEPKRAAKDAGYDTAVRTGFYPLREWGWDRAACLAYIQQVTGAAWAKSACRYCPFSMQSRAGVDRTVARYAADPEQALLPLLVEHTALRLNPRQPLLGRTRLIDAVRVRGADRVLDAHRDHVAGLEHAVYEVRRLTGGRAVQGRSVRRLWTGPADGARAELARLAVERGAWVGFDGRAELLDTVLPSGRRVEHHLVTAPAVVLDKQRPGFERWWSDAVRSAGEHVESDWVMQLAAL